MQSTEPISPKVSLSLKKVQIPQEGVPASRYGFVPLREERSLCQMKAQNTQIQFLTTQIMVDCGTLPEGLFESLNANQVSLLSNEDVRALIKSSQLSFDQIFAFPEGDTGAMQTEALLIFLSDPELKGILERDGKLHIESLHSISNRYQFAALWSEEVQSLIKTRTLLVSQVCSISNAHQLEALRTPRVCQLLESEMITMENIISIKSEFDLKRLVEPPVDSNSQEQPLFVIRENYFSDDIVEGPEDFTADDGYEVVETPKSPTADLAIDSDYEVV